MKIIKSALFISLLVLLVVLAIAFTSGNEGLVEVNYLFGIYNGPLSVALGFAFLFGFFVAFLIAFVLSLPGRLRVRSLRSKLEVAQATIDKLESQQKTAQYAAEKTQQPI